MEGRINKNETIPRAAEVEHAIFFEQIAGVIQTPGDERNKCPVGDAMNPKNPQILNLLRYGAGPPRIYFPQTE